MNGEPAKSRALEAIEQIRAAEEKARAIVREARDSISAQILREATEEAKRIKEETLAEAKLEAEEQKRAIIEKAMKEAEEISVAADVEMEELRRRAATAREEAIHKVALKIKKFLEEGAL